jgi:hypothetical protein
LRLRVVTIVAGIALLSAASGAVGGFWAARWGPVAVVARIGPADPPGSPVLTELCVEGRLTSTNMQYWFTQQDIAGTLSKYGY